MDHDAKVIIHQYYTGAQAADQEQAQGRLRVLCVGAQPLSRDLPSIDSNTEWRRIMLAIGRMTGPLAIVRLIPPTFRELQRALANLRHPYAVVHLVGHATTDGLYLEHENGRPDLIAFEDLTDAFGRGQVQLAVLNVRNALLLAQALRTAGVPAVIANSAEMGESGAGVMAQDLYAGLAGGQTLRAAYEMGIASLQHTYPGLERDYRLLAEDADQPLPLPEDAASTPRLFSAQPPHNPRPNSLLDNFVGRQNVLTEKLFGWLSPESETRVIALTGLGGVGKTTLALAAAERYGWRFPGGVIFVSARDTPDLSPRHVAEAMDLALNTQLLKHADPATSALQWLSDRPHLLILDNLEILDGEHQRVLARWLARLDPAVGTRALLTMRPDYIAAFDAVFDASTMVKYQVLELDGAAGRRLLQERAGEVARQRLRDHEEEVARAAHHHPFLLRAAAVMLERNPLVTVLTRLRGLRGGQLDEDIPQLIGSMVRAVAASLPEAPWVLCTLAVFRGGATQTALAAVYDQDIPAAEENPQQRAPVGVDLAELRQILNRHFGLEELRTLCFDINVDYDNLAGEGKEAKVRELIIYLEHRGRVSDLIEAGHKQRPDVSWDDALIPQEAPIATPGTPSERSPDLGELLEELVIANLAELDPINDRYSVLSLVAEWTEHWGPFENEDWSRVHRRYAGYFLEVAKQYGYENLEQWREFDVDWENVRAAANWASAQMARSELDHSDVELTAEFALALEPVIDIRRPSESERWLRAGLAAFQALDRVIDQGWMHLKLGDLAFNQGQLDEAERRFEQSRHLFESADASKGVLSAYGNLGRVHHKRGDFENAIAYYELGLQMWAADQDAFGVAMGHNNLGVVYREMGDLSKARFHLEESVRLSRESHLLYTLSMALGNLAELVLELEEEDQALALGEESLRIAADLEATDQIGVASRVLGEIWQRRDEPEQAHRFFSDSVSLLKQAGIVEESAKAHYSFGLFLAQTGRPDEATAHFEAAHADFTAIGNDAQAAKAHEALGILRVGDQSDGQ